MAVTLNKANLVLKDANGNIGKIEQLSNRDLAKIKTAVSDVALVVNQSNHKPIVATTTNVGMVKPDGRTITIDSNGTLTATSTDSATNATQSNKLTLTRYTNSDCNNVTSLGNSVVVATEYNNTSANLPSAHWYQMLTLNSPDANYNNQLAFNMKALGMYYRLRKAGSWGSWVHLIDSTNIGSQSVEHASSADSATNATKATQDANGNNIVNTYATKSSLSSAQTTLQNKINLVIQRIDKHEGSSAGSANARYCEKDMTDYFNTGALSTAIANNNFSELSVGNFITKNVVVNGTTYSNVKFYLAHFDYYYKLGNIATTKHHVLILPATILGTAVMNDTNTTEGGYLGSKMRKTTLPLYSAGYQSAFGSAHILGWRNLVTNNVDKTVGSSGYITVLGASQQWEWADAVCELMSESMVYGAPVWSSSGFDTGSLNQQLALFRFNTSAILALRNWYWLRNVHSHDNFCACSVDGYAGSTNASIVGGVRPFALLI